MSPLLAPEASPTEKSEHVDLTAKLKAVALISWPLAQLAISSCTRQAKPKPFWASCCITVACRRVPSSPAPLGAPEAGVTATCTGTTLFPARPARVFFMRSTRASQSSMLSYSFSKGTLLRVKDTGTEPEVWPKPWALATVPFSRARAPGGFIWKLVSGKAAGAKVQSGSMKVPGRHVKEAPVCTQRSRQTAFSSFRAVTA
mmetsp:Transcript_45265/g.113862  ORF Transcript_45265/g.113862 Transcript_45265/m.113862 type:complete len:201 (+) Transcript_45265:2767-3369(+)